MREKLARALSWVVSIIAFKQLSLFLCLYQTMLNVHGVRKNMLIETRKQTYLWTTDSANYKATHIRNPAKKQIRVFFSSSECFDPSRELMNLDSITMWKGCLSTKKKFTFRWKFAKKKRARNFLNLQKLIRHAQIKKFHSRKIKSKTFCK